MTQIGELGRISARLSRGPGVPRRTLGQHRDGHWGFRRLCLLSGLYLMVGATF